MNILEFISSLIWPAIVLVVIFTFKRNLNVLISRMSSLKISGIQTNFHELSVSDQSLIFLDGVSRKEQWTFYRLARETERELGHAFSILVEDLIARKKDDLVVKLREWLNSDDANEIWFASEVIGFFKISELTQELSSMLNYDLNKDLPPHILNCYWAHARLKGDNQLLKLIDECQSHHNLKWLIFVFEQMYVEGHIDKEFAVKSLAVLSGRKDLSNEIQLKISEIEQNLESEN